MKAHELARLLLEGPDLEVLVEGEGNYYKSPKSLSTRPDEYDNKVIYVEADDDDRGLWLEDEEDEDENCEEE